MTRAGPIVRVLKRAAKAILDPIDRLCDLADVIVRVHEIELQKGMGSPEAIAEIRKELARYARRRPGSRGSPHASGFARPAKTKRHN